MTFTKKSIQAFIGMTVLVASMTFGSLQTYAAAVQELSFPDNTVELTVCNYKFNFTKYYNDITNQLSSTPYDKFDPAGGTKYCYIQTGFTCNSGTTLGGVPVLGLFQNTVNGVTYKPQGDVTAGSGVNYCLRASTPDIFKAIPPSNNVNLIPSIYNVSGKTGAAGEVYYNPGAWDNGLCQRNTDGSVTMLPEYAAAYNDPDPQYRQEFIDSLAGRNCNVTPKERKIYQFRYTIEYPSNDICNTFYANLKPKVTAAYEADANGQAIRTLYKLVSGKQDSQFGSADLTNFYNYFKNYNGATSPAFAATGKIDCPTFYKSAFGSKFGLTSNKGIVATDTYHAIMNESYQAWVNWRKVEVGRRLSETDGLKKAWDGYAAFDLQTGAANSSSSALSTTDGNTSNTNSNAATSCVNGVCTVTINNVCKKSPSKTSDGTKVETINGVTTVNGQPFNDLQNC
jgi:hypothetical protein